MERGEVLRTYRQVMVTEQGRDISVSGVATGELLVLLPPLTYPSQ